MNSALRATARRARLTGFARVIDRRTLRKIMVMTVASIIVSTLEVAALALIGPLVQLLSGGDLSDAGALGRLAAEIVPSGSQRSQALVLLAAVVGLLATRAVAAGFVRWWTIGIITEGSAQASTNLFSAYLHAPLAFHSQRNSAELTRTSAVSIIFIFVNGLLGMLTAVTEISMLILVGMLLLLVSPASALAAGVYFGVALLVFNRRIQRRTRNLARVRDDIQAEWLTLLQQSLGGLREIRLRHAESEFKEIFHASRYRQAGVERRLIFGAEFGRYYLDATFVVGFGVLATTILLTQENDTVPILGLMLAAGFRLLPSAGRLLNAFSLLRQGEGSLSVVLDELDQMGVHDLNERLEDEGLDRVGARSGRTIEPMAISFQHVTFFYPGASSPTINGLSGEIPPASTLGIVGPSGSGKTTTVDLMCGLLSPTSGEIIVNGRPTTEWGRRWQREVAYVPQDVFLLDGSIERNIVFSGDDTDRDALDRALELAQLDEWVSSLADGLQTKAGERGVLLSGGQRQRIGIARALYRQPSLLVLDEATAALDVETESYLTSAINQLSGDLTLVIVAHRLSTIRNCDRILVLDQGQAIGWGSFDDLSATNELFGRWLGLAGMTKG